MRSNKRQAVPTERAARGVVAALIIGQRGSYPFPHITATALAKVIPNAPHRTLEGPAHEVVPAAIAPALVEFFQ